MNVTNQLLMLELYGYGNSVMHYHDVLQEKQLKPQRSEMK